MQVMKIVLLLSPYTKAAFFREHLVISKIEVLGFLTQHNENTQIEETNIGGMDFLHIDIKERNIPYLFNLSCVQGVFKQHNGALTPIEHESNFFLHEDFIWGSKFKGKTNETLTQFMLNIGLQQLQLPIEKQNTVKLLDPMCGRATTLLWGMRYGLHTKGIEQDAKALDDIRQQVKKWCKVHRQKHSFKEGYVNKANKKNQGKFIDFAIEHASMRVIHGDTQDTSTHLKGEKFHLIVSDIPYGVQHFTTKNTRNSLAVIQESAEGWSQSLKPNGIIALAFNRYIPKREELLTAFTAFASDTGIQAEHRMSESIVRDIVVLRKKV